MSLNKNRMRVLIAGAGPTGLTAAVELARRGITPDVIDRKEDRSTLSRAVGIMPSSLKTLAPSGVTEQLLSEGVKVREVQVFSGTRRVLRLSLRGGHPDRDYGIALAQDRTEGALRDALVRFGGSVTYGKELTGLRQEKERVIVETQDGSEADYDYVIGADGTQSATRQSLEIEYSGYDLPETWSIADVDAANWLNLEAATFCMLSGGRVVVVLPLEAERYRVVSNTEDALATLPLKLKITNKRREGRFQISIRQVAQYRVGRVFLAGDAAHCHSPAGGRGMNLGIADAAELVTRLVEDRLDGYSASRHAAGASTIAESERARRLLTSTSLVKRMMVSMGCRLIDILPPLQRRIARTFLGG